MFRLFKWVSDPLAYRRARNVEWVGLEDGSRLRFDKPVTIYQALNARKSA